MYEFRSIFGACKGATFTVITPSPPTPSQSCNFTLTSLQSDRWMTTIWGNILFPRNLNPECTNSMLLRNGTTHLPRITNSMDHSSSWKANSSSSGQQIPAFHGNQKFITVFIRAHLFFYPEQNIFSPRPFNQSFFKYRTQYYSSIHACTFQLPRSFGFAHQNHLRTSSLRYMCYMTRPSQISWFGHQ